MRISGLASGMDTDEMVKKLMSAHRIPMDKLNQKKQLLEWKRDDYRTLNSKILDLKNAAFDMKLQSNYKSSKVTSSQESAVTATAESSANEGQHSIRIETLASAASMMSEKLAAGTTGTTTLGTLGLTGDEILTVTGSGKSEQISVTASTTIDELMAAINSKSGTTGVKAIYDDKVNRLFLSTPKTGENEIKLALTDSSNTAGVTLQSVLGFGTGDVASAKGTDAVVYLNGSTTPDKFSTNSFTISGINFNAKQTTGTASVNITVTKDVDAVFDKIKKFVEKYNSLLDDVNKEISEKRNRNFNPLTTEERAAMSEDEIKKWEEKARSGTLRSDSLLSNGLSSMRAAVAGSIDGLTLKSLAAIGISSANISGDTISGSYLDKGKLYINEDKLKKALATNTDDVIAIFTKDGATESEDGIATRLHEKASVLFSRITDRAGTETSLEDKYEIGKSTKMINDQITRLARRLEDLETRYVKQFTAMETYMNKMNSQSSWLSQQFSS
jgi:flagellar hook-associated protein 2